MADKMQQIKNQKNGGLMRLQQLGTIYKEVREQTIKKRPPLWQPLHLHPEYQTYTL